MWTWIITKLPFIGTLLSSLSAKKRLFIEYLLIAAVITIAGFTFSMWLAKTQTELSLAQTQTELANVTSRLTTIEFVNEQNQAFITRLKELRARDAKALSGLLQDQQAISAHNTALQRRLDKLEKVDETVQPYLNSDIPASLICLLNNTTCHTD